MSFLRSLSLLPARISQILGWTADPQLYVQPFLSSEDIKQKQEDLLKTMGRASLTVHSKISSSYVPPVYKPQTTSFQN